MKHYIFSFVKKHMCRHNVYLHFKHLHKTQQAFKIQKKCASRLFTYSIQMNISNNKKNMVYLPPGGHDMGRAARPWHASSSWCQCWANSQISPSGCCTVFSGQWMCMCVYVCMCVKSTAHTRVSAALLLSDTAGAPHTTGSIYIENSLLLSDSRAKSITSGPTQ